MNSEIESTFQRIPGEPLKIFFRACKTIHCDLPLLELGQFSVSTLCSALGDECRHAESASGVDADALLAACSRFVHVNGWQSWSFAGELSGSERPRRARVRRDLNLFVDHPAEAALRQRARRFCRRPDYISHFMLGLRAGNLRFMLVSDNVGRFPTVHSEDMSLSKAGGPSIDTSIHQQSVTNSYLPPLTFLLRDNTIRIFAYAEGGSFVRGKVIARVAVLIAPDYFSLKEQLSALWDAPCRFNDLRWLAQGAATHATKNNSLLPHVENREGQSPFSGVIGGYASWYNHYTEIDEHIIRNDLEGIETNENFINSYFLMRGHRAVFQIDDGWEARIGDWVPHSQKFPCGMAPIADEIRAKGLIPGIWVAPFLIMPNSKTAQDNPGWILRDAHGNPVKAAWNPNWGGDVWALDLSVPEVGEYLSELFDTLVNAWGYRYLKLDFLYAGLIRGAFAGNKGGAWEHYGRVIARILEYERARDGSPVAFLSCGASIESTSPFMPLMRSGADTREHWEWQLLRFIGHQGRPSAKNNLRDSIGRALLDKSLLRCDPDVIFCRTERTSLKDTEKFLIGMIAMMFGSQLMSSDDPASFGISTSSNEMLSESAFTKELLQWFSKLEGKEFAVERSALRSADVFHFYSRDRSIFGGINLSDRWNNFLSTNIESAMRASAATGSSEVAPIPPHSLLIFGI